MLAFPGVFRGLLDARASEVTTTMLLRAAEAIAQCVTDEELNPNYIIPSVFNPDVPEGGRRRRARRRHRYAAADTAVTARRHDAPGAARALLA